METLKLELENYWIIYVEQDNEGAVINGRDNGLNHSKTNVWAVNKFELPKRGLNSRLTPYKGGYRNSEGLSVPTEYLWMSVESLKNRLLKL